jgi:hypothetical protein
MIILLWQMLYLIRLKQILSNFYQYTESIFKFFLRSSKSTRVDSKDLIPKTCQFCKFRLSFIEMGEEKNEPEDFYYTCQLKNIPITLEDSCESFENDRNNL